MCTALEEYHLCDELSMSVGLEVASLFAEDQSLVNIEMKYTTWCDAVEVYQTKLKTLRRRFLDPNGAPVEFM